jgi:hypothetical protein
MKFRQCTRSSVGVSVRVPNLIVSETILVRKGGGRWYAARVYVCVSAEVYCVPATRVPRVGGPLMSVLALGRPVARNLPSWLTLSGWSMHGSYHPDRKGVSHHLATPPTTTGAIVG